ncbi:MAG: hypothetical protein B7X06_01850, partial [Verrucomicrobia bacterium 21-51-4]
MVLLRIEIDAFMNAVRALRINLFQIQLEDSTNGLGFFRLIINELGFYKIYYSLLFRLGLPREP